MIYIDFNKNILLTGAGFTANFGAPLARQMWSKILNNTKIENMPEVKKKLLSNFDFEQVYADVLRSGSFSQEDKESFNLIMIDAYSSMDETLKSYVHGGFQQYGINWYGISSFLQLFAGFSTKTGAHFTLNQDILLERAKASMPLGIVPNTHRDYWDSFFSGQIDPNKKITLYNDIELEAFKENNLPSSDKNYYIKLHGSHGWLSHSGKGGMVIGKNKVEDIESEPVLKWYFELFEKSIYRHNINLIVVGYSFRDDHINKCILKAVQEYGLKIYIISPEDPETLKNRLHGKISENLLYEVSNNKNIWEAISGYFPYRLSEIYPKDQTITQVAKDLKKIIVN